jgi:hypothetical protein
MTESHAKELIQADRQNASKFFQTLAGDDDLGTVIRAHIQLESMLQDFVRSMAPCPKHVKASSMKFEQIIQLALILGLDDKLMAALSAIGGLRNKFAHRPDMKLDDETANNLYATLSSSEKAAVQKMYKSVVKGGRGPANFSEAHPKGKVGLCLVSVRAALLVQLARATHKFATPG